MNHFSDLESLGDIQYIDEERLMTLQGMKHLKAIDLSKNITIKSL